MTNQQIQRLVRIQKEAKSNSLFLLHYNIKEALFAYAYGCGRVRDGASLPRRRLRWALVHCQTAIDKKQNGLEMAVAAKVQIKEILTNSRI
jgi:hypothetical protein